MKINQIDRVIGMQSECIPHFPGVLIFGCFKNFWYCPKGCFKCLGYNLNFFLINAIHWKHTKWKKLSSAVIAILGLLSFFKSHWFWDNWQLSIWHLSRMWYFSVLLAFAYSLSFCIRPIASQTCQHSLFAILAWAKATSVSVSLAPTCQSSLTHLPAWAWTTTKFKFCIVK